MHASYMKRNRCVLNFGKYVTTLHLVMVQYEDIVAVEYEQEISFGFSNGTINGEFW